MGRHKNPKSRINPGLTEIQKDRLDVHVLEDFNDAVGFYLVNGSFPRINESYVLDLFIRRDQLSVDEVPFRYTNVFSAVCDHLIGGKAVIRDTLREGPSIVDYRFYLQEEYPDA